MVDVSKIAEIEIGIEKEIAVRVKAVHQAAKYLYDETPKIAKPSIKKEILDPIEELCALFVREEHLKMFIEANAMHIQKGTLKVTLKRKKQLTRIKLKIVGVLTEVMVFLEMPSEEVMQIEKSKMYKSREKALLGKISQALALELAA